MAQTPRRVTDDMETAIRVCEDYAEDLFDGTESFTQLTKWQDGDFRVLVWRGGDHAKEPYRQPAEKVTYHHEDGWVVYADIERRIDHHMTKYNDSRKLERPFDD